MGLFNKITYKNIKLPFTFVEDKDDCEAGSISIEAFGEIDGEKKYFYVTYMLTDVALYNNGEYEAMLTELKNSHGKEVEVCLKYKKNKISGVKIEPKSLAESMANQRFESMTFVFSSISDSSWKELSQES